MIIQATRITTSSGAGAVGGHVFSGPKNEAIELVQGSRADLDDMVADAEAHGAKYAIRHFSVSPEQAMTREQALEVVRDLGREFGFDPVRAVVVEHQKPRQDGAGHDRHWHAMVPEVDPVRGRVLDAHWMRARHEKVARVAELRLGHDQVTGRWNRAVEKALRAEGRDELADRVATLGQAERPRSAYTSDQHQIAQRQGRSLPELKVAVVDAWQRSDGGQAFAAALAEQGMELRPGAKKGVWIVQATGQDGEPTLVGAVDRLVRERRAAVADRLDGVSVEPDHQPFAPTGNDHTETYMVISEANDGSQSEKVYGERDANVMAVSSYLESEPAATKAGEIASTPMAMAESAAGVAAEGGSGRSSGGATGAGSGSGSTGAAVEVPPAVSGGADTDYVEPLDPHKPGDAARFLRQVSALLKRQAEAAARGPKGKQNAAAPDWKAIGRLIDDVRNQLRQALADGRELRAAEAIAAARRVAAAQGDAVDGGRPARASGRGGGPEAIRRARPQGDERPGIRDLEGRGVGGRAAAAAGAPVAAGGAVADAADPRSADRHRREPDPARAAAGRARIADFHARRALAGCDTNRLAGLTERLRRGPLPPAAAAAEALRADQARVERVLAGAPWPDGRDRDPGCVFEDLRDELKARNAAMVVNADQAEACAAAARDRVGFLGRLGLPTADRREADRLEEVAQEARRAADQALEQQDQEIGELHPRARAVADLRRVQQEAWQARPDVQGADRDRRANQLVAAGLKAGDPDITAAAAASDLDQARRIAVEQERQRQEVARRQALEVQRQQQVAAAAAAKVAGPAPAGPRFR